MFAAIADSYDLNNRLHSFFLDQRWRKAAVGIAAVKETDQVVDVACGTGDLTLAFAHSLPLLQRTGASAKCRRQHSAPIGIDFTFPMLPLAIAKTLRRDKMLPSPSCVFLQGDAQALPLANSSADVVSIAFGIRNVADPAAAIREFFRILRPGGRLIILEFSVPSHALLRTLYNFYFRNILPRTATLISGDKTGAYRYLPQSVNTFTTPENLQGMMEDSGFQAIERHPLTFGVCTCYRGVRT